MAENSNIEWTDHTLNPWIGCTKVAPGCGNCYAEADFDKRRHVAKWGAHGTRVKTSRENWMKPLKWNRDAEKMGVRARVFCASLADVFEEWDGMILDHNGNVLANATPETAGPSSRPLTLDDLRADLFAMIDATPHLDWLLLTKRPENIRRMWPGLIEPASSDSPEWPGKLKRRDNVWLGTSISDQATAGKAIPELFKCRDLCPVLFVSAEPLLGPVDLSLWLKGPCDCGRIEHGRCHSACPSQRRNRLDWVIVGGESGYNARPCNIEWIRGIVQQCQAASAPVFVKQMGAVPVCDGAWRENAAHEGPGLHREATRLSLRDRKGGDWTEWPIDLRVRQFPAAESAVSQ